MGGGAPTDTAPLANCRGASQRVLVNDRVGAEHAGKRLADRETTMAVDGEWKLVIETPMGPQEAQLTVRPTSDTTFDGAMSGQAGQQTFEGAIEGSTLTWQTDITSPMPLTLEFNVTVDGDALSGETKLGMFGTAPVTGVRV